ncbi:MAG: hypothetical protein SGBAC_001944 [Bacillariaceae sp.]
MPSIKGTSSVSDLRARRKALKATRFPANYSQAVELEKVNKQVLTQWIEHRVNSILGFEDEIVSSMAINLFLPEEGESPDPKRAQLDLVGFLGEEESASFARDLWTLMLEAQESATGIPKTLLEEKKKELAAKQAESRSAQGDSRRDPDMNRFVEEANRRANAARGAMVDDHRRRHGQPPVPVSPPRHERQSSENRNDRRHYQDRSGPPEHRRPDYLSHPGNHHPGRYDRNGPRMPPGLPPFGLDRRQERRRSRSRSPDRDRDRTQWGRVEGRKDDGRGRRNPRPRFYDEEDEMRFLERRLDDTDGEETKIADEEGGIPHLVAAEVGLPRSVVVVRGAAAVVRNRGLGIVDAVAALVRNRDEVIALSLARAEVILVSEVEDAQDGDTPLRADQVCPTRMTKVVPMATSVRRCNSTIAL